MSKVVIFCAPGFLKKTGYYFRCFRDKANFELAGHNVELLVFKPLSCKREETQEYKIINFIDLFKYRKGISIYFAENISMLLPIVFIKSIIRVKANFGFVYHGSLHELKYDRLGSVKYYFYRYFEKYADKNMDFVFFISRSFKRMLNEQGLFKSVKSFVTPNFPEQKFLEKLNVLNSEKRNEGESIVLTYVGNVQRWQNIDYIISLFKKLNQMDERIYLQLITSEVDKMTKMVKEIHLKKGSFNIFSVPNQDIPFYLVNSDCLLIIRDVNDTNRASCPTKAVEYLLSKTKLLVSDELGDISDLVTNYNLGYVVKDCEKENLDLIYKKIMTFKNKKNINNVKELSIIENLEAYKNI